MEAPIIGLTRYSPQFRRQFKKGKLRLIFLDLLLLLDLGGGRPFESLVVRFVVVALVLLFPVCYLRFYIGADVKLRVADNFLYSVNSAVKCR